MAGPKRWTGSSLLGQGEWRHSTLAYNDEDDRRLERLAYTLHVPRYLDWRNVAIRTCRWSLLLSMSIKHERFGFEWLTSKSIGSKHGHTGSSIHCIATDMQATEDPGQFLPSSCWDDNCLPGQSCAQNEALSASARSIQSALEPPLSRL